MGWLITLGVLAALAVLPLGVSVSYDAAGPVIKVILGPVRITVFPVKKKERKNKQQQKEDAAPEPADASETEEEHSAVSQPKKAEVVQKKEAAAGGSVKDFLPLMQVVLDFLGDFRRKLRVKVLYLKIILAGDDPADLGILYGRAWEAVGNLWPRLERLFVIQKRDVQIECDFTAAEPQVTARLDLSITLGRLTGLGVRYGIRAVKEFMKIRKNSKGGANQ